MKSKSQLRLIYLLTCLALLPIFALSGYYIYESRENVINEKVKKLHAISQSKQVTLENHLENYILSMQSIASSEVLVSALETGNFENGIYDVIMQFQEKMWGASHHIFVANPKGEIVLSPHHGVNLKSTHLNHSIAGSKYFKSSLQETQVTDFFGFEESTHYHQLVMVPIKKDGLTLGVMISEITIQYFIDLLRKDFDLGETGEIFLSTLEHEKVVHLKKNKIIKLERPLLSEALLSGKDSYGINMDSDGREILGSYLKSKKFPWALAVEVSKEEVVAPINLKTKWMAGAYLFFIALFLLVFKRIVKILKKPVEDISRTLESISEGAIKNSLQMKENTSGLVSGSMKLAEALVENQGQLEKVVGEIRQEAESIKGSLDRSREAQETASKGNELVQEMTRDIQESNEENLNVQAEVDEVLSDITKIVVSIRQIQERTKLINDIVFQTKLLSFNASVEAARAGEHGKGFAVVAEEVGNLAAMSGKASIEIHEMIEDSVKQVETVVEASSKKLKSAIERSSDKISHANSSVSRCQQLFEEIKAGVNEIYQNISDVSRAADEKVVAIDEVNDRFIGLKEVSEQSSNVAHAVGSLTEKIDEDSTHLGRVSKDLSEKFAA